MNPLEALIGETLTEVKVLRNTADGDKILFTTASGKHYQMYHQQDCCESVTIDDIVGDVADLVGSPVTVATEQSRHATPDEDSSQTWTFYKLATAKGWVDIRWWGASNGYYSEGVSFEELPNETPSEEEDFN